ncbi:MAG: LysE family transporter [Flavobacteriaceae bacterium]|jgi:threonine/homoserine/homoserine lactone efflux protein|nr:LysE family transporter [Flavobacteriaceae bacterium]
MISLIISAIAVGFILSIILIGPVFFLLIETSLTKGIRPAIVLEAGVISADLLCIVISHYSSQGFRNFIDSHPSVFMIGGFLIIVYGLYNILSRGNLHIRGGINIATTNYFKTYLNGFLLNLVNIGVIVFWMTTVVMISTAYPKPSEFYIYMLVLILTMISFDLVKIFLASAFQHKLTDLLVYKIKKVVGVALIVFGVVLFAKSFMKPTDSQNPFEYIESKKPQHQQKTE